MKHLLLLALITSCTVSTDDEGVTSKPPRTISGQVISLDGQAISGASIHVAGVTTTSDANGHFTTAPVVEADWVQFSAPGYVGRIRMGHPDYELLARLSPNPDGKIVTLAFGGDTMMGRRFFDQNDDGDRSDALVRPEQSLVDETAGLRDVIRLLQHADYTALNLETPLYPNAPLSGLPRLELYHQTKEFVFASSMSFPQALAGAGVDLLGLANNHLYDALEAGIDQTLVGLEASGFALGKSSFGAGPTQDQAWRPAVTTIAGRGESVGVTGCTTITGIEHPLDYIASENKGGAAGCDEAILASVTRKITSEVDIPIAMIHGGYEYGREPTGSVIKFSNIAREAGAKLIINHHPHVVGGFDVTGDSLTAWSLGNFIFDQTVWPTFQSYFLFVEMKDGEFFRAYAEPLMIYDYLPKGLAGPLADYIAAKAASLSSGPVYAENGAIEIGPAPVTESTKITPIETVPDGGAILQTQTVAQLSFTEHFERGEDLLWVGDFEAGLQGVAPETGPLWLTDSAAKTVGSVGAAKGAYGVTMTRSTKSKSDAVLSNKHRMLADPGQKLTLQGRMRSTGTNTITVSWYPDTKGGSRFRELFDSPVPADGNWHDFRIDLLMPASLEPGPRETLPNGLLARQKRPAVGLFFKLKSGQDAELSLDELKLIAWQEVEADALLKYPEYIRVNSAGTLSETTVAIRRPSASSD